MGRKINSERVKKGPGRKTKKQKDPVFAKELMEGENSKKLTHRQKHRAMKRNVKRTQLENKNIAAAKMNIFTSGTNSDAQNVTSKINYQKSCKKYADKLGTQDKTADASSKHGLENIHTMSRRPNRDILADISSDDDLEDESETGRHKDIFGSDDDTGSNTEDNEQNSEESEEDADMLPIERASKICKKRHDKNKRLAESEMQELIKNKERFQFPEDDHTDNFQDLHMRIKELIGVLADFSMNRDPARSRADYIDLLRKDLCLYYSYNEFLIKLLMQLFSPNHLLEFLESSEVQRPLTIRTNSLKTRRRDLAQALINRGVNLDPIGKWSKDGLVVYNSQIPLGATPEYLSGHYMIQGASSMLPVMALAPEENERILDLCAAPGGKSSHIAALMKNTGVLFANDVNKERLQAVVGNFHRSGIHNAIVTNVDGTKYSSIMTGFDRVLLDAPCTGTGVISKDTSVKNTKTDIDVQRCYNLQRKLLLSAIDCLSAASQSGGFLVYSTCSILPHENEWVIDYALRKRNVRLVSTNLEFGNEGLVSFAGQKYHPSMKLTRRFYPHTYNMDGFFVAKLQKFSDIIPNRRNNETDSIPDVDEPEISQKRSAQDESNKIDLGKQKDRLRYLNHVAKTFQSPSKKVKGSQAL